MDLIIYLLCGLISLGIFKIALRALNRANKVADATEMVREVVIKLPPIERDEVTIPE